MWILVGLGWILSFGFLVYVAIDTIVNFEEWFLKQPSPIKNNF